MNIAVSPDPALLSAPDPIPGLLTGLPNGFSEIPFADLLGMTPESSPEEMPGPRIPSAPPRKQATDPGDPALMTLLPFLAQQIPQTPPAPALPPPPEGANFGAATEGPASKLQTGSTAPATTQDREIFLPRAQLPDSSRSTEFPPTIAGKDLPSLASDEQDPILQTGVRNVFAMAAEDPNSPMESMTLPGDALPAEAIERQPVQQSVPQSPRPMSDRTFAFQHGSDAAAVSAPEIDATSALQAATNPPAGFSPAAIPVATPATMPMNGTRDENHSDQVQPERNSDQKAVREADGTTAAMQLRAMPEQFTERTLKAKMNGPATPSETVQNRTAAVSGISGRNGTDRRIDPEPAAEKRTLIRADAGVERRAELPAPVQASGEAAAPTTADATAAGRITRQTMDLAEHVRAMGRDHVEVQMRLRDGEEVTVSLRLEKGEWKPVFKTDSEALCRALEQNWNRAVAQPSAQAVRFGTPVFESQQTQAGGGQGGNPEGHRQPDARERSFNRQEQEPAFAVAAQPIRTAATPIRPAATPAVQIYA